LKSVDFLRNLPESGFHKQARFVFATNFNLDFDIHEAHQKDVLFKLWPCENAQESPPCFAGPGKGFLEDGRMFGSA
jgi:hypothetical protein